MQRLLSKVDCIDADEGHTLKIVHYSHQLGMGGTEKCMQYFLEYLHHAGHDCYCVHNRDKTDAIGGHREALIKDILGEERVLAYSSEEEFFRIIETIHPDIFHIHRSGRPNEFPIVPRLKRYVDKCVETNVFGGYDPTDIIDLTLYVSGYFFRNAQIPRRKKGVLYNPVRPPSHSENLRNALGISLSTFVMGRIGRPDDHIFDPISLYAHKVIEEGTPYDILHLVQSPPPTMIQKASELGLKKIKFLTDPIVADHQITQFLNTIDVFAHAGKRGETFGSSIAEAMIHGKPIISHRSRIANGHEPFVRECGYFAETDDYKQYAEYICTLYASKKERMSLGEKGRKFARKNFLLADIGRKLESHYWDLLGETASRNSL